MPKQVMDRHRFVITEFPSKGRLERSTEIMVTRGGARLVAPLFLWNALTPRTACMQHTRCNIRVIGGVQRDVALNNPGYALNANTNEERAPDNCTLGATANTI